MASTLLKKIGVREGMRSILISAPAEVVDLIGHHGENVFHRLTGNFDYIHLFVNERKQLDAKFPKLRDHLKTGGMLWVSWPKGRRLGTDLTLASVIEIGYNHGMVESKTISLDSTWSAIKFTFPKEGKEYNNSYGRLKRKH